MQLLRPDPMAKALPKRLAATDPTLFAALLEIFRTPMPARDLPPGLMPSGARNTTRNFTGR
jgi:hypothetical protein